MHINKIQIINFKGIKDAQFKFDNHFNLITGNNGTGKTSILEAICVALGGFISGIDGIKSVHFTNDQIRIEKELLGEASFNIKYVTPVKVECDITLNNDKYNFIRQKKSVKAARSTVEPRDISKKAKDLIADNSSILPLISYQSFSRIASQKRDRWAVQSTELLSRCNGYVNCLDEATDTIMITSWFKRMEYLSWKNQKKISEFEAVKNAISKFMSKMLNVKNCTIYFDGANEELMFSTDDECLPIRLLSSGFRTLIGMVLDIASRMAVLNPNLLNDIIKKTPGIVLIDELDMHLHPKWQWMVVAALKETFPSIQFIATTHSPLIIGSCKDENLISLGDTTYQAAYAKTKKGWQIDDVLLSVMNTSNRDPETNEKLNKIGHLTKLKLTRPLSVQEEQEYQSLIAEVKQLLPEHDLGLEEVALSSIDDLLGG
jgi:predicted ATP-binding protein involved in virulence